MSSTMSRVLKCLVASAGMALAVSPSFAATVPTTFTYQGRLADGSGVANGNYDFIFQLFNASSGGSQVGVNFPAGSVAVSGGVFTVPVDFGAQYDNTDLWLQIQVRATGSPTYTTLSTRQHLTGTPYAQGVRLPLSETGSSNTGLVNLTNTNVASHTSHVIKAVSGNPSGLDPLGFYQPVIFADTDDGNGIFALTSSPGAYAVYAVASNGYGVVANVTGSSGNAGDFNVTGASSSGDAVNALTSGTGNAGSFTISNAASAAECVVSTTNGTGRSGHFSISNAASDAEALRGSTAGTGVGVRGNANGAGGMGVYGTAGGANSYGVYGTGSSAGVYGECGSSNGAGVYGVSTAGGNGGGSGVPAGVRGDASSPGVAGGAFFNNFGTGVYAQSSGSNYAGYFSGNVHVNGTLSKTSGSFKIDHPLDPENKYLSHSFVESPDMKDMYDGVAVMNAEGVATIELPTYFEALNQDFRYQLTCIGGHADVYIASEIASNRFTIAGGKPGLKVSWQVTGTRHDKAALAHPIIPEENKAEGDRGRYLNPEAFGQPRSTQIGVPAGLADAAFGASR